MASYLGRAHPHPAVSPWEAAGTGLELHGAPPRRTCSGRCFVEKYKAAEFQPSPPHPQTQGDSFRGSRERVAFLPSRSLVPAQLAPPAGRCRGVGSTGPELRMWCHVTKGALQRGLRARLRAGERTLLSGGLSMTKYPLRNGGRRQGGQDDPKMRGCCR